MPLSSVVRVCTKRMARSFPFFFPNGSCVRMKSSSGSHSTSSSSKTLGGAGASRIARTRGRAPGAAVVEVEVAAVLSPREASSFALPPSSSSLSSSSPWSLRALA